MNALILSFSLSWGMLIYNVLKSCLDIFAVVTIVRFSHKFNNIRTVCLPDVIHLKPTGVLWNLGIQNKYGRQGSVLVIVHYGIFRDRCWKFPEFLYVKEFAYNANIVCIQCQYCLHTMPILFAYNATIVCIQCQYCLHTMSLLFAYNANIV